MPNRYFLVDLSGRRDKSFKRKASHPWIVQYFCSKPKQKFLAVSLPESANTSNHDCKNSFDSVVQEAKHSTVRISNASSVSAKSQSYASHNQTFNRGLCWKVLMNPHICMLNDKFPMLKASSSYHRPRKKQEHLHFGACQASIPKPPGKSS